MYALRQLLNATGSPVTTLSHIKINGADPIFPTPFRIGELGAAALAAVGYGISEHWFLQTGRRQTVSIEMRDAVIAQRSHQYFRPLEGEAADLWDPLSGFYPTKDHRWIQLHCNFPHHRQGVVKQLGCADEKSAVASAIFTGWNAEELEMILASQGLCASMVRTGAEWQALPQAQAVASLPPLEIIKIAESPVEPLLAHQRPLTDIKVLDLTRVIAGPVCARTLAEHGATVLHITSPALPSIRSLVMDTGHGKWSAQLDLTRPEDHAQLMRLAQTADVFSQAYRPGGLAEKGFSVEKLAEIRPGMIYVDLSAYSHLGPWSQRHGYDSLVQSATGIVDEQSNGLSVPQHLPAQTLDYVAGYIAAFGVIEALRRRSIEGGSYHVRTSLAQIAYWLMSLGRVAHYADCAIPSREAIAPLLTQTETLFGRLEHLTPVLKLSETAPFWGKATAPLGSDPAEWPRPED